MLASNVERMLLNILGEEVEIDKPGSRIEELLLRIINEGAGGGISEEECRRICDVEIAKVVADAPEDFDTLVEISDWIYEHEDSAAAMNSAIQANSRAITALQTSIQNVYTKAEVNTLLGGKVDVENGKDLSTNDYTDTEKAKVATAETVNAAQDALLVDNAGKNLLRNNASSTAYNGITFTVNDNKSVGVSGTATARANLFLISSGETPLALEAGDYILSSGVPAFLELSILRAADGARVYVDTRQAAEVTFTIYEGDLITAAYISVSAGNTIDTTIYPMIRRAAITDGTYEPYYRTQKQLDADLGVLDTALAGISDVVTNIQSEQVTQNDDISALQDETQSTKTASGSMVHIEDAAGINAEKVEITLEPKQDLHGYDRPWAPGTGKNKWSAGDVSFTSMKEFVLDAEYPSGTYTLSGNMTSNSGKPSLRLFAGLNSELEGFYIPNSENSVLTFTTSNPLNTLRIYGDNSAITSEYEATLSNVQLEAGSTATAYEPYANICPIEGYGGAEVVDAGKNLLPATENSIKTINTLGVWDGNAYTLNGVTFTQNPNGVIDISGTATGRANFMLAIPVNLNPGDYIISVDTTANIYFTLDISRSSGTREYPTTNKTNPSVTVTINEGDIINSAYLTVWDGNTIDTTVYPMIRRAEDTDGTYKPYQGKTISADFPTTVYGVKFDFVSGKLVVDRANIASYDGETLPGEWVSDRDIYSAGTTPTTGAQVVYALAEPITYQLTPQQIALLRGENNIWSEDGDIEVGYQPDNVIGELKGDIQQVVKSFTYTGDGSSTNNITFPEVPKLILCISGPGNSGTYCSSQPSVWGAPNVFTRYAYQAGATGVIQAPAAYSGKTMTLTQTDLGASLNVNGETYTVVYI